ncbi:anaerobic C4-dicarboxylate transporter [Paraflavitalea sp. CAU 1676]|uniref:anaerobic C4-dicarboxylate transporter family protein n=1 Tax=Paraflavitalea sp. CAU 1676 TaxID=3032598 RepID=UPI0023DA3CE2|nr:anaerobic C4-dicarboxylate transporter [Paraflavitalea sp. CAU 1676]MDF2187736.1 anaerobic C4-dicarboxylate transporter [Paraflavitalea sp. CAU 1676]
MITLIQLIILLAMILIGSRMKGIGLGVMGMVGLLIFVLVFHLPPAEPPIAVLLIILAIVTTAATLQAAGGLDYLVSIAEKIIRSNPSRIVFIAPFTTYFLCLFAGTSHLVYSLLPIIAEVSAKKRIRPERPLTISVIASHLSLTGSPMSAATATMATVLATSTASVDIMKVCIPSCLMGILAGILVVRRKGKELTEDPEFLEKMKDPAFAASIDKSSSGNTEIKPGAKLAVGIFAAAILLIIFFGSFPQLVPNVGAGKPNFSVNADGSLNLTSLIIIITLSAAALMMLLTRTAPSEVTKASLFTSMATAVVSVLGVVWMSATFMDANEPLIKRAFGEITQDAPWTFAFALFLMGALTFSQAATTRTMMPMGVALGISNPHLLAMFPAVNGDFLLPGYPTLVAAMDFDRTGTTRIGKFVINHSFIIPGLTAVLVTVAMAFLLSSILL